ncbi:phage tail length tape measure family protein [Roseobacter sp. OBYS 0001]|uniref:phage tail length tape measure family protein n=1 Tax=Roseobacter sp. OBYS 0001 TaxID=882651 RepID=UPI001BC65591|nr:phage tail length tape measure family protein [Roseobacter sp. OBYS 0001]GIT85402.1 hypothetical protein ROBYS_04180 [Roseobacter sp. OBYS 0001]
MTLKLSMLVDMNAKQALNENERLKASFRGVGSAAQSFGDAGKISADQLNVFSGKVSLAKAKMTELKVAQIGATLEAKKFTSANRMAAGSLGNLTAQFNDIGVMLAAGQNPLQLALQQGTQITQVIGPMGAGGAVKALGSAFMGMINPVSLATIGIIAGGAALFQYAQSALSAEDNSQKFADALAEIEERTVTATDNLALLKSGMSSIAELQVQNEISRLEAERQALANKLPQQGRGAEGSEKLLSLAQQEIDVLDKKIAAMREVEGQLAKEEALQGRITAAYKVYARTRLQSDQQQRESLQAQYRLYAETRVEASALSQQLLEAYDAGRDLASVDMPKGVEAAAAAAAALAERLGVSLDVARGMVALGSSLSAPLGSDQARSNVQSEFFGQSGLREADIISRSPLTGKNNKSNSGGGADTDKIAQYTQSLRDELAILREMDPIQKELIRNRETLAGATQAQRNQITGLLGQHAAETSALKRKQFAWDTVGSAATGVLDAITNKSKSVSDTLRNLAASVLDVVIQGQLLGTGPFGNGGGGLIGAAFPMLIPGRAEGGPIFGPGGPKDDKVLFMGSNGEHVMNARAASRYRPILELMNAGVPIPGLANGGMVGTRRGSTPTSANGNSAPLQVNMDVSGARGDREIEEAGYRGMQRALAEYDRETLPQRVGQINEDPRMRG